MTETLVKPDTKTGLSELAAARAYYKQKPRPTKAYPFARYKGFEVRLWLDQLCKEKCAYCETDYKAVDSSDVEHYRPKGGVTDSNPPHPGYWWLAAAWTNLLPSCPPCNQRRRQAIYQMGMSLEDLERMRLKPTTTTTGKANAFPLKPGSKWVTSERGNLVQEDPLLINPCERNPAKHLEWVFDWDRTKAELWNADRLLVAVRPRKVRGTADPYAHASIGIYGLNRDGLLRTRMARAQILQRDAAIVVRTVREIARLRRPRPALQAELEADWKHLRSLAAVDQPYAAMGQAFIALFEAELPAFLAKQR